MLEDQFRKLFREAVLDELYNRSKLKEEELENLSDDLISDILDLGDKLKVDKDILTEGVFVEGSLVDFCKKNSKKFKKYLLTVLGTLFISACFAHPAQAFSNVNVEKVKGNDVTITVEINKKEAVSIYEDILKRNNLGEFREKDFFKKMNMDPDTIETLASEGSATQELTCNLEKGTCSGTILLMDKTGDSSLEKNTHVMDYETHFSNDLTNQQMARISGDASNESNFLHIELNDVKMAPELINQIKAQI